MAFAQLTYFQVLSVSLFKKMPVLQAFEDVDIDELKNENCIQRNLFDL